MKIKLKCDCIYTFPIDFKSNGIQSKFFNGNRLQCTWTIDDEMSATVVNKHNCGRHL